MALVEDAIQWGEIKKKAIDTILEEGLKMIDFSKINNQISEKVAHELFFRINPCLESYFEDLKKEQNNILNLLANKEYLIKNLNFNFLEINVDKKIDAEEYVINYYKNLGWEWVGKTSNSSSCNKLPLDLISLKSQNYEKGTPDLILVTGKHFVMVEVKTNGDGLRIEQIQWIKNHPTIPVVVLYLKQNILK